MKSSQAALLLLFLLSLGTLSNAITFGWGRNDVGQLGLGHRSMVYRPTQIAFFNAIELLDTLTATNYIIFISKDGPAYGSGYQYYGQFANGYTNTSSFNTPILCPSLNSSLDISLPGTACNANFNTNLLGWGNLAGYVLNRNVGSFPRIQTALPAYRFDGKVLSVHSAMEATIIRLANNSVWSSGNNGDGRLGIGHTTTIYNFSPMTFWTNVPLKQIFSSQSAHICALAVNGSLFCWGRNSYGQLGVGDTATHYTPTLVPYFDVNGYEIYKVVYGDASTFVLTCGGTVFSFGANGYGQLGYGNPTSYGQLTPKKIEYSWDGSVVDIVAGIYQVFARTDNNVWYVWGAGTSGALGIGFATDLYIPNRLDSYIDTNLYRMNKIKSSSQSQNFFGWWDDGVTNDRLGCPVLENECLTGTHLCDINAQCSDFERGYNCSCRNGYAGDGRLTGTGCINQNTCSLHPTLCDVNALCEDTPNGPACTCLEGFTGSGLAGQCADINECEQVACGDNTICTNTAPGYYCTCMEGYYGDQPDVTGCKIICQPGQYAFNTTYCAMCEPGRYSDVEKATNCMPCPAGTYAPDSGTNNVTGCLACPVGGYSDLGAMYCSLCIHGYTNDPNVPNRDNSSCFPCPLGTYGYYGQCLSCNGGQYSDDAVAKLCKSCPPGYSSSPVNTYSCVICPAGTSSRGGTTGCNACPAGYFSAAGSKDCSKCPPGTSTNGLSSRSACTNCSAGYFASKAAAQSCQACPAGTYAGKAGSTDCTRCDRGTFGTGTARSNCSDCAFGTYSPGTAATKCINCESGSQSSPDRKSCIPCTAGEYFDSPTDTCKPCSIGTSNPFVSALSCTLCAPGSYASESGSTYCKRCPVNTYSNAETGYGTCTACPPGQKSGGGASSCS